MAWRGSKYSHGTKISSRGHIKYDEVLSRLPYSGIVINFHVWTEYESS